MKVRDNYPLSNLIRFYGFHKGWLYDGDVIRVNVKSRKMSVGGRLWISNEDYYQDDIDILVRLIKAKVVEESTDE